MFNSNYYTEKLTTIFSEEKDLNFAKQKAAILMRDEIKGTLKFSPNMDDLFMAFHSEDEEVKEEAKETFRFYIKPLLEQL
jgi:hypothetical protein